MCDKNIKVICRKMTMDDIPAVGRMWARLMEERKIPFHEFDEEERTKFMIHLAKMFEYPSEAFAFVCFEEDDPFPIGFTTGSLRGHVCAVKELVVNLDWIYVDRNYRQTDAFMLLTAKGVEWAKGRSSLLQGEVALENVARLEGMGFRVANVKMIKRIGD